MRHAARIWWCLLGAMLCLTGCATQRADRLFAAGDYAAAIDAYENHLVRQAELSAADAPVLMNLALAHADPDAPTLDPARSQHYLRLLADLFPRTAEGRQAVLLLEAWAARQRAERLEAELARRNEQLASLRAVLTSVAQAETRLRGEVESKDETAADLTSRVERLTRTARSLTEEIAALQAELEAIKRIDLESATRTADPP